MQRVGLFIILYVWLKCSLQLKILRYLIETINGTAFPTSYLLCTFLPHPLLFHTEESFGCTASINRRFHHEQKQERKRVLQHRCWGFNVYSSEAVSEPKTYRVWSPGYRVVCVPSPPTHVCILEVVHCMGVERYKYFSNKKYSMSYLARCRCFPGPWRYSVLGLIWDFGLSSSRCKIPWWNNKTSVYFPFVYTSFSVHFVIVCPSALQLCIWPKPWTQCCHQEVEPALSEPDPCQAGLQRTSSNEMCQSQKCKWRKMMLWMNNSVIVVHDDPVILIHVFLSL